LLLGFWIASLALAMTELTTPIQLEPVTLGFAQGGPRSAVYCAWISTARATSVQRLTSLAPSSPIAGTSGKPGSRRLSVPREEPEAHCCVA
jgi:hypothetical protein